MKKRRKTCFLVVITLMFMWSAVAFAQPKITVIQCKAWVDEVNQYLKGLAEEWGRRNNVDIEYTIISESEYYSKFSMVAETQRGADIIMFSHENAVLAKDAFLDVSDLAEEIQQKLGWFPAGQVDYVFTGEGWIGIPLWEILHAIYYRSDWFAEAGLPTEIPYHWTYSDLLNYALKVTDPARGRWGGGMVLSTCPDAQGFQLSAIWNFGGSLWTRDGKTVTADSYETLQAVKWLKEFYTKTAPPGIAGWNCSTNNQAYLAGKIAMTDNAPSIYAVALTQQPELAKVIKFAMNPFGPNGTNFSTAEAWGFSILKTTKYPDLCKDFIRYLAKKEHLIKLYTLGRGNLFPATMNEEFFALPVFEGLEAFGNCIKYGVGKTFTWPARITRPLAEIVASDLIAKPITKIVIGEWTPEQALKEAKKEYEQIIARYR